MWGGGRGREWEETNGFQKGDHGHGIVSYHRNCVWYKHDHRRRPCTQVWRQYIYPVNTSLHLAYERNTNKHLQNKPHRQRSRRGLLNVAVILVILKIQITWSWACNL